MDLDRETERLIEKRILHRFDERRDEEIQAALQAVTDNLKAQGRDDITYQTVYSVYLAVMMY
ncbi:hypothetical protein C4E04_19180 [Microvirga sp. 17 mud 1-3]|nr:hypothetical protein C4E04_19180 [Microvirga sp. 17 mud 1-3]